MEVVLVAAVENCGVMVFVVEQNERAEKVVMVEAEMVRDGGGLLEDVVTEVEMWRGL